MACFVLAPAIAGAEPPMTKRIDHVDDYHGTSVADPYRWLEDDVRNSNDVAEWVKVQNEYTGKFLEQIPERDAIRARLTQLWDFEKFGTPFKAGGRYYFYKNDGLQNQYVLYRQNSLADEPTVLIDPNKWSEDGTVALSGTSFSDDGRYLAYGVQDAGSDWRVWHIMEIESGRILEDKLEWVKFNTPVWAPDGSGLFYGRFPEPEGGAEFQNLNTNQKIYFHKIGQPQAEDVLVFHRPDEPKWGYSCDVSEDGHYLVITVHLGTDDRYRVFVRDLTEPYGMAIPLVDNFNQEYTFIGNDGPELFFKTDLEAPLKRVIAVDYREIKRNPPSGDAVPPHREIIAEGETTLDEVSLVGSVFIANALKDARSEVTLYRMNGEKLREVELPGIGTASGFGGQRTDVETFYTFSSFATPPSNYRYDILTGESKLLQRADVDFNPEEFEVKQVFYESKDGTKVPMFIAHKKGIELNGNNPTLLYGYGGFNIPLTPSFSISRLAWMDMGGVYAVANLRGGGEYGEKWHKAGTKLQKQNVFDDFIAAAEYLIAEKYTQPKKLAIQGGSNGGLLVGACLTQRPDLYGACLPAVGVMDMLRFHMFTAGRYWTDDYGCSDNPEEFKALYAYSPYHNCKPGVSYPPTLVTTADTDDRVVPGHSFKFAAALQHAQAGDSPILIRIETKAGHGAGKPTAKIIDELTDLWAFLVKNLDFELPAGFGK
ncbi:MAG: S9 family peptidase [Planctomycetaceae bacterium]|nr:S9 family peptidase [Planctomycetaceae bacterium]